MCAELIVDQLAPIIDRPVWIWVIRFDGCGNPRDVEVVEFALEETIVGETAEF